MPSGGQALLLGTGHAHLYGLKRACEYRRRGDLLTIAGPARFWYSGLATGVLGGEYGAQMDQIDIASLAAAGGAQFFDAEACVVDAAARTVSLGSGAEIHYDVLSLNVGSVVAALPGEEGNTAVFSVKPLRRLWELRTFLEALFRSRNDDGATAAAFSTSARTESDDAGRRAVRIVVVGGGATGCEIAANVVGLAERHGARVAVTIVTESSRLLKQLPASAARDVATFLAARGARIRYDVRVTGVDARRVMLTDGAAVDFDALVNATGLKPSPLIKNSGLAANDEGALLVDAHLRSVCDPHIFGGGDCIAIEGHPLPKIGVYAIRQAPVLHRNLQATLHGERTERFEPQRHFLSILNLGDGTALATRNRLWWRSRCAFRLKDWIDRRFLQRYR